MSLHTLSVAELAAGLRRKDFSATELTRHFLARCEAHNGLLNGYITLTAERALADAAAADARLAAGTAGPLTGIPLAQKDIFCTDGIRTTCGSRMLANFVSPYDATFVERLTAAGTVLLGKTNMDEFAMGSSNETSYFGPVRNPWDIERVPGGSSGGSAAVVAARLAPVATGTDTGGSIRQPAALTGISGIKPTYGRVSRYGMIAFASSLDQAGIMAPSAEDCALFLEAIAGFDSRDSTSVDVPVPAYAAELGQGVKGLRIGIVREFMEGGLDPANAALVRAAVQAYADQGAEIVEVSCPNMGMSVPTYYVVAPAECSSNLSRFDGVRFGHRCDDPKDLLDLYKRSRGEGFGAEVKRRIMTGTYVLSAGYYDAYYLKAQKVRQLISREFAAAFAQADVLVGPTSPTPAFRLGDKVDDPITMYLNDIFTIGANLAGLPAMSIPCGLLQGLPVGLQLIGPHFAESRLLATAHAYQQVTDWHRRLPAAYA
ncbi:MAG: Asp-tRNA(Asn)/Glu-tRNA(Gln) amidotransferase subunit GatA [Gammaproteobacteria bacterium]